MSARTLALSSLLFSSLFALGGCAGAEPDDAGQSEAAMNAAMSKGDGVSASAVRDAIGVLAAQRSTAPLGTYYEDGNRLEGCWRNPAGNKLTDLKKAFYCSMPLEFRLCNTVVLLTTDEAKVDARYQGYLDCQKKVDRVFGSEGRFVYDANINAVYKHLYLEGQTLSDAETESIVSANKPAYTSRSFVIVLAAIGESLAREAIDLSMSSLSEMVDSFKQKLNTDPR